MSETAIEKTFSFKIGADPEFVLLSGEKFVPAMEAFTGFMKKAGLERQTYGFAIEGHGNIGWDGANSTGEVRPAPSNSPKGVVLNLHALFSKAIEAMPFLDFSPLSLVNTTGGHIHLEVPEEMSKPMAMRYAKMLCAITSPLLMGENKVSSSYRRSRSNYGTLDDVRVEKQFNWPSGSDGYTAEIRFPSAEWVITPHIAEATLTLFAVIWDALLTSPEFRRDGRPVSFHNTKESEAMATVLSTGYAGIGASFSSRVRRLVRTAPRYEEFKTLVDFAMNGASVLKEKDAAKWIINQGWGFSNRKGITPTKKSFLSDKTVAKTLGKNREEEYSDYVPVTHNGDFNLTVFEGALAERVVAFKWRPSREYFLFGLKEGRGGNIIACDNDGAYTNLTEISELKNVVNVMMSRAKRQLDKRSKIDVRTAKIRNTSNPVLIGIPFAIRAEKKTKEFLSLILDIDKGKIKPSPIVFSKKKENDEPSIKTEEISTKKLEELVQTMGLAIREGGFNLAGMVLDNLNEWTRGGTYSVRTAETLGRHCPFAVSASSYLAWYTGDDSSMISLGENREAAEAVYSYLLDIPALESASCFDSAGSGNHDAFRLSRDGIERRADSLMELYSESLSI